VYCLCGTNQVHKPLGRDLNVNISTLMVFRNQRRRNEWSLENITIYALLVKQELLTLPEPPVLVGMVLSDFKFSVYCIVDHCWVLFLLTIVMFVLWFTASVYTFGILDLRLLFTPLVSLIYGFCLHLWYLWFTASVYTFGIFDLRLLFTPLVS
jgi:hypothetical protein